MGLSNLIPRRQSTGQSLLAPGQNDGLGIAINLPPLRAGSESGNQGSVWRQDHGANPPRLQRLSPVVLQVIAGTEFVHESVAIDVSPAVQKNAILGIQLPDEIPSPVVVVQHRAGRLLLLEESSRGSGKMLRFRFSLAPHYLLHPERGEAGEGQEHNQIKSQSSRSQAECRLAR